MAMALAGSISARAPDVYRLSRLYQSFVCIAILTSSTARKGSCKAFGVFLRVGTMVMRSSSRLKAAKVFTDVFGKAWLCPDISFASGSAPKPTGLVSRWAVAFVVSDFLQLGAPVRVVSLAHQQHVGVSRSGCSMLVRHRREKNVCALVLRLSVHVDDNLSDELDCGSECYMYHLSRAGRHHRFSDRDACSTRQPSGPRRQKTACYQMLITS